MLGAGGEAQAVLICRKNLASTKVDRGEQYPRVLHRRQRCGGEITQCQPPPGQDTTLGAGGEVTGSRRPLSPSNGRSGRPESPPVPTFLRAGQHATLLPGPQWNPTDLHRYQLLFFRAEQWFLKRTDPNLSSGLHMSFSHSLSGAVHATESSEVLATRISIATKGGPFMSLTARAAFVWLLYAQLLPLPSQRNLQT